ncbi:Cytochrome P450 709B2 [Linum perenne]
MGYTYNHNIVCSLVLALIVILAANILQLLNKLLWRPYVLTRHFRNQGIHGPPYRLLHGSLREIKELGRDARDMVLDSRSNDIVPKVMPHYHKWFSKYGKLDILQILSNKLGLFVKTTSASRPSLLLGKGLVMLDGPVWASRRRILNPAFSMEKLKVMINRMTSCTLQMISEWPSTSSSSEIELNSEFKKLTADIIAHTCFGTSYLEGIQVFKSMKHLQTRSAASLTNVFIPGTQYLPTLSNLEIWKLDRELNNSLMSIVQNRRLRSNSGNNGYGDDLLGVMIDAKLKMKEIMGECRSFFFSGHQTTSNLLTWAVFLLSVHQEWQEILRDEVIKECGMMNSPDSDSLPKLKLMNMVLLETLRLYSPALEAFRTTTQDMKLGNLDIPKGTSLFIPIIMIHRSRQLWGHDSNEFKPTRFENGVSMAANHPNAFLSFGIGPRVCIGQNFAMMQAKSVLAMILQRFSFTLSSVYKHAPGNWPLQPQFGLPVVVKSIADVKD